MLTGSQPSSFSNIILMAISPTLKLLPLETYNTSSIGIADLSIYPTGYTIEGPTMEITPPGFPKVIVPFNTGSANVWYASDIGITCDDDCSDLPDGIYTFTYSVTPASINIISRQIIRIELLRMKYQEAFLSIEMGCPCSPEDKKAKNLQKARMYMEAAVAAGNSCDYSYALKMYKKAEIIIESIKC